MGAIPRIGLRRTQAVDDLLRGIWELRPELERKNTTTILLGLESFLRECKAHARTGHPLPAVIDSLPDEKLGIAELKSITERASDDVEW